MIHFFRNLQFVFLMALIPLLAQAETTSLNTRNGGQMGLSVSSYLYEEPSLKVSIKGDKLALRQTGTRLLSDAWFVQDELQLSTGNVDYSGSGIKLGLPDFYAEGRGLIGRDFELGGHVYSPFIGLGYRYLFNDLRGYSSTLAAGYRRESNYIYLPIGVTHRMPLSGTDVLATTVEYSHLLRGLQVSRLSDLNGMNGFSGVPDIANRQNSGYGIRFKVMYESDAFAFGPYFTYWKIADSQTVLFTGTEFGQNKNFKGTEPHNSTSEFGLRIDFRY